MASDGLNGNYDVCFIVNGAVPAFVKAAVCV